MAFVNYSTQQLAVKIVYYGPGLSGKTTNLRYIYSKMDSDCRGDLICLETNTERTIFFDLLPIKAGLIHNFKIHFQLLTVPGQVFYEASRKNVLRGADGIVFVADSQVPLLDANLENFDNLRNHLLEHNVDLNFIPLVFQYNKRDLDNLIPVETFNNLLNPRGFPAVESSALYGWGVLETLKAISKQAIPAVREKVFGEKRAPAQEGQKTSKKTPSEEKKEEKKKTEEKRETVEFASREQEGPLKMTKVKFKDRKDVEKEIENLAQEFTKESED
ncbi:GTPase domain-containing protein [bacterium]|nr:GTPase domain-containing protein [bacterium]